MRLRQIEVFHAVYSSGSMTSAAALLNVSQPSVSKVLAHAEQQLGYLLFDRLKGKLVPTPEAHRLFAHVSTVYRDVDRLRHVAANLRAGNSGRIRVASTPAFGLEVLPQAVASFRSMHDDIVFEIETLHLDQMQEALLESRVDLGLAFDPVATPGIDTETLASSRFVAIAHSSIELGDKPALQAGDLCDHPFVGLNSRGPLGRILSAYLEPVADQLKIVTWSETYHVAKALVAAEPSITIADEITARSGGSGDLQILQLDPELRFDIKVLRLAALPLSIAAQNFVRHLRQTVGRFLQG
ncbi:MAG: LysR family transcriptional regulator [Gammaproteobacteria bacterium]|nr:LysR family transcriptional regulator [Gammaproteobacteria bacterium]